MVQKNMYLKLPTKLALLMVVYNSSGLPALKLQISTVFFYNLRESHCFKFCLQYAFCFIMLKLYYFKFT